MYRAPVSSPTGLVCSRRVFKNLRTFDEKSLRFCARHGLTSWDSRWSGYVVITLWYEQILTSRTSCVHNFFNMAPFSELNAPNQSYKSPLSLPTGLVCSRRVFKNLRTFDEKSLRFFAQHGLTSWDSRWPLATLLSHYDMSRISPVELHASLTSSIWLRFQN